jgi:hypothetical protein
VKRPWLVVLALSFGLPRVARAEPPTTTTEQDEDYVTVKGRTWASPRGVGDLRIKRELLEASPRQQTSEFLSAAPGFFVDHEDGEGLGNDIFLRGFDLSHGAGIEMRLGAIPINIPLHIQGQGYVDANFIIPEVVRSVRVLQGPYDPRQGDAAIVGSAYFDIGVVERGYQFKTSIGSFNQGRLVAIAAPKEYDEETFAAVAVRHTDGFGVSRRSESASAMAQYATDLSPNDRLKLTATAYGTGAELAGVVRRDDVDAGRIGFDGRYPELAQGQGVGTVRVIVAADYDHQTERGSHIEIAPWAMWTNFRARQNYTGNLEIGARNPALFGLGDLYETRNREGAAGFTARHHSPPRRLGDWGELAIEPGLSLRAGHTVQGKDLLRPDTLATWDRRFEARVDSLDAGAWIDFDARLWKRLHLSIGPRADVLSVSTDDRLRADRTATGVAAGPRATLAFERWPELVPVVSYGEGFRSLDVDRLPDGAAPYSKVRSGEIGARSSAFHDRFVATVAAFETYVENELVFEAQSGGLETQKASVRRGVVTSLLARPASWLLVSSAFSVTRGQFTTLAPGISHYVPSIPSVLFRTDATARGPIARWGGRPVTGRAGVGYTFLGGRHLTDAVIGAPQNILNANIGARLGNIELGFDAYNVLGLDYPDDENVYASNWTTAPRASATAQARASIARHISAAPPRTVLGSLTLYF